MSHKRSIEDYLEAILVIRKESASCRCVDVAAYMEYSKPSVSIAMAKLESEGYIDRREDGQLYLTPSGEKIACEVLEKHSFLTSFFQSIGVSEKTAREDACKLEHSLSAESYEKFKEWFENNRKQSKSKEKI
ncbi:MAG: metal-dependent transcriptional regulator [Ruminococcaceae bacterium]|nr:metal-dependent transcriptional regulator [Oscillospiraceae bacterium]